MRQLLGNFSTFNQTRNLKVNHKFPINCVVNIIATVHCVQHTLYGAAMLRGARMFIYWLKYSHSISRAIKLTDIMHLIGS